GTFENSWSLNPMQSPRRIYHIATPVLAFAMAASAAAQPAPQQQDRRTAAASYADLADLAESASLVLKAQVRKLARVENGRAAGPRPGGGRFYVQARTRALLTGQAPRGEAFSYLVDLPLDGRGKPPAIKKADVLLFARPVAGRPAEIQLVAPGAQ